MHYLRIILVISCMNSMSAGYAFVGKFMNVVGSQRVKAMHGVIDRSAVDVRVHARDYSDNERIALQSAFRDLVSKLEHKETASEVVAWIYDPSVDMPRVLAESLCDDDPESAQRIYNILHESFDRARVLNMDYSPRYPKLLADLSFIQSLEQGIRALDMVAIPYIRELRVRDIEQRVERYKYAQGARFVNRVVPNLKRYFAACERQFDRDDVCALNSGAMQDISQQFALRAKIADRAQSKLHRLQVWHDFVVRNLDNLADVNWDLNKAYKQKALRAHPDKPSGSHEKMQQLNVFKDICDNNKITGKHCKLYTEFPIKFVQHDPCRPLSNYFINELNDVTEDLDPVPDDINIGDGEKQQVTLLLPQ